MAKKKKAAAPTVANLRSALPADVKVISVPLGATVEVDVDVNEMAIPYTIATDGKVVIKALVDRREELTDLTAGTHRVGWGFSHTVKGWSHTVTLRVNGKSQVLEQRSEANKDPDHSIGVAFLFVS